MKLSLYVLLSSLACVACVALNAEEGLLPQIHKESTEQANGIFEERESNNLAEPAYRSCQESECTFAQQLAKSCKEESAICCKESRFAEKDERKVAFNRRTAAACLRTLQQKRNDIEEENNGDEKKVAHFAANFTKTLEHSPIDGLLTNSGPANGELNYQQLVKAINNGEQADFNAIVRAPGAGTGRLVNPQGALAFSLEGADSSTFKLPLFPRLCSKKMAAQMMEMYLMELARDVHFNEYGTGINTDNAGQLSPTLQGQSITSLAACVLQDFGKAYTGPRNAAGIVDASVVFRGNFYGSLIGPYVSQFLLLPIKTATGNPIVQPLPTFLEQLQIRPIAGPREFGVGFADFVAIENGKVPKPYVVSDFAPTGACNSTTNPAGDCAPTGKRYLVDGRDLANVVHWDQHVEFYYDAAKILTGLGFPLSSALPYQNGTITNEAPFVTMGQPDYYSMVGEVTIESLKACWAQKWRAQRVLRPEAFGGLVQNVKTTGLNPFCLNKSLFEKHCGIDVLALVQAKNTQQNDKNFPANAPLSAADAATFLLSQVYPEASPAHPSYPAGHAVIAGACITVLKAIFEDTALISSRVQPVVPDPTSANPINLAPFTGSGANQMTVASELDKLAFNSGLGRDWAGIHWRADGLQGVLLGEQVAIKYLQDHACTYTEQTFTGFVLTKVDGTRIRITADKVETIG